MSRNAPSYYCSTQPSILPKCWSPPKIDSHGLLYAWFGAKCTPKEWTHKSKSKRAKSLHNDYWLVKLNQNKSYFTATTNAI